MSRRRVLVTGGAGFIGSHVADAYLARGDEVYGVARLREDPRCDGRTRLQVSVSTTMPATATPATTG